MGTVGGYSKVPLTQTVSDIRELIGNISFVARGSPLGYKMGVQNSLVQMNANWFKFDFILQPNFAASKLEQLPVNQDFIRLMSSSLIKA